MKRAFIFAVILVLLVMSNAAFAQTDATTPIFFVMEGDIWSYTLSTGQLRQETTWGYNEQPILSPDGTRFVYLSLAQIGAEVMERDGYLFDPQPMNIWLWNIATGQAERLLDQPATTRLNTDGFLENAVARRSLTWSPDGKQLAWIQIDSATYTFSLIVYDLATRTERLLTQDIPFPYADAGYIGRQKMRWGAGGIALETANVSENPNPNGSPFQNEFSVYDPFSGATIARNIVANNDRYLVDFFWMNANEIILEYISGEKLVYFVNTGGLAGAGQLELYSPFAAANPAGTGLFVEAFFQEPGAQAWHWVSETGQAVEFRTLETTGHAALAPSGDAVAYVADALYIIQNDATTKIPGTETLADSYPRGVVWGVNAWRMVGEMNPNLPNDNCPLAPRLTIGGQGVVIPGLGNNVLRDIPGKNADGSREIGSIPPNGVFTVLAGPQCVGGYHWWQVNYNGQIGWTAEGENGTYWLEPR